MKVELRRDRRKEDAMGYIGREADLMLRRSVILYKKACAKLLIYGGCINKVERQPIKKAVILQMEDGDESQTR